MKKALGRLGWSALGVEAQKTDKDRTSGGVAIVYKQHLHVSAYSSLPSGEKPLAGDRWVLGQLRLKGTSITVAAAYFHTGQEADGDNLKLLKELGVSLKLAGRPFLYATDWSMTPESLRRTGWLARLRASVLPMPTIKSTCAKGRSARVLDFFVVSDRILTLFGGVDLDLASPFKPHSVPRVSLRARPREVSILKQVLLKQIPETTDLARSLSWEDSETLAKGLVARGVVKFKAPAVDEKSIAANPRGRLALDLGDQASLWTLTTEVQTCAAAGIELSRMAPYLGRCQFPKLMGPGLGEGPAGPGLGR